VQRSSDEDFDWAVRGRRMFNILTTTGDSRCEYTR